MRKNRLLPLFLCLTLALSLALVLCYAGDVRPGSKGVVAGQPEMGVGQDERRDGSFFNIVDDNGQVIDRTARVVRPGDELIIEDNRHYRVTRVRGDTAYAELLGRQQLDWREENKAAMGQGGTRPAVSGQQDRVAVAVYHTHTDESYLPTSGTESRPADGDIFVVGETFVETLRGRGVTVDYSKQPHEPHDNDAYRRSRRTAFRLISNGPVTVFDIHRDGVPDVESFTVTMEDKPVAKIRFVVGRQNQNMGANLDYAKGLKAYLDEVYPGLVRGIYLANGNYNQDLHPRSLIVEMGTYTNSRQAAQRGAALFGEAVPRVLGIIVPPSGAAGTRADWSGVVFLILGLAGAGFVFLWLSAGSLEAVKERLQSLFVRLERLARFRGR